MDDIQTLWKILLYLCSSIAVLGGGITWVKRAIKPYEDMVDKTKKNEQELSLQKETINEIKKTNQLLLEAVFDIIDSQINDNELCKESLREKKDEIEKYLINR